MTYDVTGQTHQSGRVVAEVNNKDGSSTDDWNDDDCDHVSINGGVESKRGDRDIDNEDVSASLAEDGRRPTKSRRLDANAPTSSMWVRPVAAASDTAEKDGGDTTADDHSDEVSDVTRSSATLSWLAPMSDAGAASVACVVGRVKPVSPDDSPMSPFQTEIKTQRPLGPRLDDVTHFRRAGRMSCEIEMTVYHCLRLSLSLSWRP